MTARAHRFGLAVHAVDDAGSVCGVRPRGGWVASTRVPVTCPRCLFVLSQPRYVFCGVPENSELEVAHVRLVGPEGIRKRGGQGSTVTLCGKASGWDRDVVGVTPPPGSPGVCGVCVKDLRRARSGLNVDA